MTTELHVAIMKKSLPGNRFSKEKNQANRDNYKIQLYLYKTLLGKTRNSYISNLDKNSHRDIITDEVKDSVSDEKKNCQIFNTFFSNVVSIIDIPSSCSYLKEEKFDSLWAIREHFEKDPQVSLLSGIGVSNLTPEELVQIIRNLYIRKGHQMTDIPTKVIKFKSYILAKFIYKHFNYWGEFPNELKHSELVPGHKKTLNLTQKEHFQRVCIRLSLSKLYGKILYSQLYNDFLKYTFFKSMWL